MPNYCSFIISLIQIVVFCICLFLYLEFKKKSQEKSIFFCALTLTKLKNLSIIPDSLNKIIDYKYLIMLDAKGII